MVAVKLYSFGGMVPAVDDRLLPDFAAAHSENAWLYSGALTGLNEPTLLRTLTSPTASKVYRIPNNFADSEHLTDATWMEFEHPHTDVLRGPVIGDTFERYYWASPADVPRYNTLARIQAGNSGANAPYKLGIPAPSVAPTVNPTGGASSINRTTAYVYTWVSQFGEEGPPSPPTTATGKIDATWQITLTAPAADDVDGPDRDIDKVRIYRTVTAANGVATFHFVAEQTQSDTTYDDTALDSVVALNSTLQSTNWFSPPTDLQGWVAMPNGIFAGWRENEIWFSEPYRPHAWPPSYALAVDYPIVGFGVVGQTLVVVTQSYPYVITGIHPAAMTQARLMSLEPGLSRGSIVSAPEGVYYVSANGLILVASGTARNITQKLITKDRWQELAGVTTLATMQAARLGHAYYGFGAVRTGVFQADTFQTDAFQQQDFFGSLNGIFVDPQHERVAFNVLSDTNFRVMSQNDAWTGELFIIHSGKVYWIDIAASVPTYTPFLWKSKIFQSLDGKNFAAMKVYFDTIATTPTQNPVRNTAPVQTLAADQYGIVRVYADGELVTTREIRTSGELMRIPAGFHADFWQFEIEARVKIKSLQFATSARDLARV